MAEGVAESCPVCSAESEEFASVDGYRYFACADCGLIFIDRATLAAIDAGHPVVIYSGDYWEMEAPAARERARSAALARIAETVLLCRVPINAFIDIGSGPGVVLDEIARYLPVNVSRFFAVELFPPSERYRTRHPNFIVGSLGDLAPRKFEAGLCMEMVEHLTPTMMRALLRQLADVAAEGGCFLFNTGLAGFVREEENRAYVDPTRRGHICFWTVEAVNRMVTGYGLRALPLPGREWAFLVEKATGEPAETMIERLRNPVPDNVALLADNDGTASVLHDLGFEASSKYLLQAEVANRGAFIRALRQQVAEQTKRTRILREKLNERRDRISGLKAALDKRRRKPW